LLAKMRAIIELRIFPNAHAQQLIHVCKHKRTRGS
jgi:hypothetical protein